MALIHTSELEHRTPTRSRAHRSPIESMTRAFRRGMQRIIDAQERRARIEVAAYLKQYDEAQLRKIGYTDEEIERLVAIVREARL